MEKNIFGIGSKVKTPIFSFDLDFNFFALSKSFRCPKCNPSKLPIKIIEGSINEGDAIVKDHTEIGKILISKNYPFALIKHTSDKFDYNFTFEIKGAKIKIVKPDWL